MLSPDFSYVRGDDATRATNLATKLREPRRTDSVSERSNERHKRQRVTFHRYRTQEVAGSSPASSIVEALHLRGFSLVLELKWGSVYRRSIGRALVSSVSFQASRLVRTSLLNQAFERFDAVTDLSQIDTCRESGEREKPARLSSRWTSRLFVD